VGTPPRLFFFRSAGQAIRLLGLLSAALIAGVAGALGADWPQFLGPARNSTSSETGLCQTWPASGPPVVWAKEIGAGFSGPVVAGGRLILFHRLENNEIVACLDAATGQELWKYPYPTTYQDKYGKDEGPRASPLIARNRVYTLGADGRLLCLELDNGKKVWDKALLAEYEVPESFFGVATSPLLEGDLLLVNVGGKEAGIVAFDKDNGREVWKATSHEASYSSPVVATLDGKRQAIFFTREGIVFLDPRTGQVNFSKHWRARLHASVNAATPVLVDDYVFVSASYGTGAILLRAHKDGVEEVWKADNILSNHYTTSVYDKGYLFGFDGRQEGGAAQLRCVELKTGKVAWTKEGYGCGSMILADGNLVILHEDGDLILVEATSAAYKEKARATMLTSPCRSPLALADGRLYGRDTKRLVCWNLKKVQ
jgi:hypothetical protein